MAAREAANLESEIFAQFSGSAEQFHLLAVTPATGLPIGVTRTNHRVSISLFRPDPTQLVIVGQQWLAAVVAFRAAAVGASVVIATDRPGPWEQWIRNVGGGQPFAYLVGPNAAALPTASPASPVLVVYDGAFEVAAPRSAWQASLYLLPRLHPGATAMLDGSELILLPQPTPEDVGMTVELLRLPPPIAAGLTQMAPTELLAITRLRALPISVQVTATESALLAGR